MNCLLCDEHLDNDATCYQLHIKDKHAITRYNNFVLGLFLLNDSEIDQLTVKLEKRLEFFKSSGKLSDGSNDDIFGKINNVKKEPSTDSEIDDSISGIQSQLEFDDSSSDEDDVDSIDESFDDTIVTLMGESDDEGEENASLNEMVAIKKEKESTEVSKPEEQQTEDTTGTDNEDNTNKTSENATKPKLDINSINLAEKFKQNLQCKLCYKMCQTEEKLKVHEDVVHKDDQEQVKLTHFTLKDLVFPCEGCPGVRFLTENILIGHTKLEHGKILKPSTTECKVCNEKVRKGKDFSKHMQSHKENTDFECNLCYAKFKKNTYLQAHQGKIHLDEAEFFNRVIEENEKLYPCKSCDLRFVTTNCSNHHFKRAHGEEKVQKSGDIFDRKLKCYFCPETFPQPMDRKSHWLSVHNKKDEIVGPGKVKCMVCSKIVKSKQLLSHRIDHFTPEVKCKLCFVQMKKKSLFRHETIYHNSPEEKEYLKTGQGNFNEECIQCNQKFLSEYCLMMHRQKLHTTVPIRRKVKVHTCPLCYLKFKRREKLSKHQEKIHANETEFLDRDIVDLEKVFPCESSSCDLKFVSVNSSKHHHKRIHQVKEGKFEKLRKPKLKCYFCEAKFVFGLERNKHCLEVHNKQDEIIDESRVKCMVCDKIVLKEARWEHRKKHSRTKNGEVTERKLKCYFCPEIFSHSSQRKNHWLSVHNKKEESINSSNVRCMVCSIIVRKAKISEHRRKHFETAIYKCILCYLKFKEKSYLQQHTLKIHSTEKDFLNREISDLEKTIACESTNCDLKFVSVNSSKHHYKRVHKEEKLRKPSLKCYFCEEVFVFGADRNKHCSSVHNKEDEVVDESRIKCMVCAKIVMKAAQRSHRLTHSKRKSLCKKINRSLTSSTDFSCRLCQAVFFDKKKYIKHIKNVHRVKRKGLRLGECNLCYKKFNSVKKHKLKSHSNEKEFWTRQITNEDLKYSCTKCPQKFVSQTILSNHLNQHEYEEFEFLKITCHDKETSKFKCCLCFTKFQSYSHIVTHANAYHKEELSLLKDPPAEADLKYPCPECGTKFVSEISVFTHRIHVHYAVEDATCSLCDLTFKNTIGAFYHRVHTHKNELEVFKMNLSQLEKNHNCDRCNIAFYTNGSLHHHRRKKHYAMFQKDGSETRKSNITETKRSLSNKSKEMKCKFCYLTLSSNSVLQAHFKNVHLSEMHLIDQEISDGDLKFKCDLCDLQFVSQNCLKLHKQRHERTVTCFFCPSELEGKSNLDKHCLDVHQKKDEVHGDKLKCMVCEKLISKKTISSHREIHTDDKFKCKLCYKEFSKTGVIQHCRSVHKSDEEKNFLKFGRPEDLKFSCDICDYKFYSLPLLNLHSKQHLDPVASSRSVSSTPKTPRKQMNLGCNLCYVPTFQYPYQVREHQEKIHTSEEEKSLLLSNKIDPELLTVSCTFCDKKFVTTSSQRYHRQYAHKEEMKRDDKSEIPCEYCGRVFIWKNRGNLKTHMKKLHNIEDYDVTEHTSKSDTTTVTNFMDFLNSLQ